MKPVTGLTPFAALASGTTTQLDNNFIACTAALNDLNTYSNYLTDTGAVNSLVVTLGASLTGPITEGLVIQVKVKVTNTGATTLNYNGGGALNLLNANGSALSAGQLQANAIAEVVYDGTQWRIIGGAVTIQSPTNSSIAADIALNNTGSYFIGPNINQGANGTWYVGGAISLQDTAGSGIFNVRLTDGTTVIASTTVKSLAINAVIQASFPPITITSPAANLRIEVNDSASTSGKILWNISGGNHDSYISALRIA